jgi:hypothetical protein
MFSEGKLVYRPKPKTKAAKKCKRIAAKKDKEAKSSE